MNKITLVLFRHGVAVPLSPGRHGSDDDRARSLTESGEIEVAKSAQQLFSFVSRYSRFQSVSLLSSEYVRAIESRQIIHEELKKTHWDLVNESGVTQQNNPIVSLAPTGDIYSALDDLSRLERQIRKTTLVHTEATSSLIIAVTHLPLVKQLAESLADDPFYQADFSIPASWCCFSGADVEFANMIVDRHVVFGECVDL